MCRLIWVCNVCLLPFYGFPGAFKNGLKQELTPTWNRTQKSELLYPYTIKKVSISVSESTVHLKENVNYMYHFYEFPQRYTSIQMKCQGGVIFVLAPRLFYYPKRRKVYAPCSLTGNKNYPAITKLTNTMNSVPQTFAASHPLSTEPLKQSRRTVVVDTTLF